VAKMSKLSLSSTKIRNTLLIACVLTVVCFAFTPTLKNDFVLFDDDTHLYHNITVRTLDAEHIGDIFTGIVNKTYIPLTSFSFAIEHHYFGFDPFIYHLDNLLLHLGIVLLIFWLGLRLGLSSVGSGIAALLFGIHPMHVESVAWVTERKDVLYSLFYLASMVSYSRYLDFTKSTPSLQIKKSYLFLVLSIAFGVLSMLSKPMALSLPLILFLMDWFYGRKISRDAILEKLPLIVVIAGLTWITYSIHARVPGEGGIYEGILIWMWTLMFYIKQFAYPAVLVPIYQLPKPIAIMNPEYLIAVIVTCLAILMLIRFRRHRWFIFACAFYFFSIFFLLRFDEAMDANIVADRFMYLPSLGFCVLMGYGFQQLLEFKGIKFKACAAAIFLLITIPLTAKTYAQSQIWHNSISLWKHQLNVYPLETISLNNFAAALREEEEYKNAEAMYKKYIKFQQQGSPIELSDEAAIQIQRVDYVIGLYMKAIQERPGFIVSYYHLGNLFRDIGRIPQAVDAYKRTLSLEYDYKDAHFNLGGLYQKAGDYAQAVYAYDQTIRFHSENEDVYVAVVSAYTDALKEDPDNAAYLQARGKAMDSFTHLISTKPPRPTSFFNLGFLYGEMGNLKRAISAYQMVLDMNPNHSNSIYNLGNIYKDQGRLSDALRMYQRAVKVNPRKSEAFLSMGTIYARQGKKEQARENFQQAAKFDFNSSRAYFNLGYIEEREGNLQKAVELYQKSIELDSKKKEAHYNLGNTYARLRKNSQAIASYLKAIEMDRNYMDAWINLSTLSFKEGDFVNAVKYCDEATLLGYRAPQGYLNALAPHRVRKKQ